MFEQLLALLRVELLRSRLFRKKILVRAVHWSSLHTQPQAWGGQPQLRGEELEVPHGDAVLLPVLDVIQYGWGGG